MCDKTTLEMRGPSPQDRSDDSRQSRNATNTLTKAYKIMIKVEIKLIQLWFKDYKIEKRKIFQKIEHFSGSF
jgi:hypothetical protein